MRAAGCHGSEGVVLAPAADTYLVAYARAALPLPAHRTRAVERSASLPTWSGEPQAPPPRSAFHATNPV